MAVARQKSPWKARVAKEYLPSKLPQICAKA